MALQLFEQNPREKWYYIYKDLFIWKKWHIGPENEPMSKSLYRKIKVRLILRYGKFWK